MAWVDGEFMHFEKGKGYAFDATADARFTAAERAMDAGETIYLTEGGQPISKMYLNTDEGYVEELL